MAPKVAVATPNNSTVTATASKPSAHVQGVASNKVVQGVASNKVVPEASDELTADGKTDEEKKERVEIDDDSQDLQEGSKPRSSGVDGHRRSRDAKSQQQNDEEKMKNGCQKCCGKVMKIVADDAIYGSFFGPHPVSFLFCCALFKKSCSGMQNCSRPFCVASIATKIMNFIMLGVVAILAGFFIFPWPTLPYVSPNSTALSSFYPCQSGKMIKYKEANGGCSTHAGYFMAYRCFFAFASVMLTNCILMLRVSNTRDDPYRSKVHHGFWFYKYLYLTALLFAYFFMVNGERDKEGLFEFVASVIGNIAHMIFSLIEITYIMDLIELWVYEHWTSKGRWTSFIYCCNTFAVFVVATVLYVKIWLDFSSVRMYTDPASGKHQRWPSWPADNCIEGEKTYPDWKHTGLIIGSTGVIMLLIIVMSFRKVFGIDIRYPYTGWLQIGVMILINLGYLLSALTNSSNIHSRPHCNVGLYFFSSPKSSDPRQDVRSGSWGQYFAKSGLFHGLLCLFALTYFTFVHGPRSNTAPLSLLYTYTFRIVDRIPVFPDEDDEEMALPIGFLQAIQQTKVWDDEQVDVAQSWSLFYFMMVLGSLSLMMSMTNFTNPWAADHYNSSNVAFGCKFGTAAIASFMYILMLISKCNGIRDYGQQKQNIRKRSVKEILEFDFQPSDEENPPQEEGQLQGESNTKQTFSFHLAGKDGRKSVYVNLETTGNGKVDGGDEGAAPAPSS